MNFESFTYWLQGFVELSDTDSISEKQWLMIKDHLKLVFDKKTPDRKDFVHLFERPKPVDLIGKQFEQTFWNNNPPVITC